MAVKSKPTKKPVANTRNRKQIPSAEEQEKVVSQDKEGTPDDTPAEVSFDELPLVPAFPFNTEKGVHVTGGYCSCRHDLNLTPRQAITLKSQALMLSEAGARVDGGKRTVNPSGATVETQADAIRWMLGQAADTLERVHGGPLGESFPQQYR